LIDNRPGIFRKQPRGRSHLELAKGLSRMT
jgi:hypothetical protein